MVQSISALQRRADEIERQYRHYSRTASKLFARLSGLGPLDSAPVSEREYRYYSQAATRLRRKLDHVRDIIDAEAVRRVRVVA